MDSLPTPRRAPYEIWLEACYRMIGIKGKDEQQEIMSRMAQNNMGANV